MDKCLAVACTGADERTPERISFETHPSRYRHWRLDVDGPIATLTMAVDPSGGLRDDYELKLNTYDLGVDIELHDALQRLRFEHPGVKAVVLTGGLDKLFCAGANIQMLATSTHAHKVGFCKFTNETRNGIEEMSSEGGQVVLAAVNGTAAGGGYELALACDEILLVDDRSSAVSLPEVPLLAVLPGTGGLTRVVDKRHVRRDLADVFSTKVEGIKGKQAVEWGLVDAIAPPTGVRRARAQPGARAGGRIRSARRCRGRRRCVHSSTASWLSSAGEHVATITVRAFGSLDESLEACRELDDAILDLRFNDAEIGTWVLRTEGDAADVLAADRVLDRDVWLAREVRLFWRRTLKRLDMSARTLVALVTPGSCFAGTLAELALAADRTLMLDDDETALQLTDVNDGWYPMANGLSRLATRFWGRDDDLAVPAPSSARTSPPREALDAGLVTSAPDDLDWDDEVRILLEERAASPPTPHRHGGEPSLPRARDDGDQDLRPPDRVAELDLPAAERGRRRRRASALRHGCAPDVRQEASGMTIVDLDTKIPNNVGLSDDRRLQRVLEGWLPKYIDWWRSLGPVEHQGDDVFLRTAISVGQEGWANFDYVRMPDYRWGIFLADAEPDRRIAFGDRKGEPVWQEVPGEHRGDLRRLLVVQGDTEPASVEQQRHLCRTAPSLYDMRNLFQVNVEEGRHLWAMVYLLHRYFGRDGRDEADELLERHSGDPDNPRILGAFNEPTPDWLSFYFFTYFTDRDGKFQLASLRESVFDPLSRTCDFMLKEEAHHMFVGATGVGRVGAAHGRAHEAARHRRHPRVRRHRRGDAAAVPELPLQRVARPVRCRDIDERGELLRLRPEGPLPGGATRRRPSSARTPLVWCLRWSTARSASARCPALVSTQRDPAGRLHRGLREGRRPLEPDACRSRRSSFASPIAGSTEESAPFATST